VIAHRHIRPQAQAELTLVTGPGVVFHPKTPHAQYSVWIGRGGLEGEEARASSVIWFAGVTHCTSGGASGGRTFTLKCG